MRNHYWTCSKFADWLRGTPKPKAETSGGWARWHRLAQAAHPVRYWLADDGLDYLQKFVFYIPDKLYGIKYYVNNRWVTKTHALTAHPSDIPRGEWRDVGYRFLPCLFNELRDFVEVELAWWHIAWHDEEAKKYQAPFWSRGWFRWRTWRCPEAGLDSLAWQMNLTNKDYVDEDHPDYGKPTTQAINAREILELYKWWTETYPNRPDPHDVSGWSEYCKTKWSKNKSIFFDEDDDDDDTSEVAKVDTKPMLDMMRKMEEDYDAEDEAMMIRLIKVRHSLWT